MCANGQRGVSNAQLFIKKNHRFTFENGGFLAKVHEVNTILQKTAMQQPYPAFVADSNVGCKILIINKNWRFECPTGRIIPLISFVLFR